MRQLQPANHLQQYNSGYQPIQQPQYQTGGYQYQNTPPSNPGYQHSQAPVFRHFNSGQHNPAQTGIPYDNAAGASGYRDMPAGTDNDSSRWRVMQGAFGPQEATNPSDRVVFIPGPGR